MVLSVGFVVYAADAPTITLKVAETPTYAAQGFVGAADLDSEGDLFEVIVTINGVQSEIVKSADMIITWDPAVVTPVTPAGTDAVAVLPVNYGADFPVRGVDPLTYLPVGAFDWGQSSVEAGKYLFTVFTSTEATEYKDGVPLNGKTDLQFAKLLFKVVSVGDPNFNVTGSPTPLMVTHENLAPTFDNSNPIVIGGSTVDPEPQDKVVTGLAGDAIEVEDAAELPEKINVIVDGETVEVAVTWNTEALVDGEGTATAVLPEGYVYAEGVEIKATVKKAVVDPEPENKVVNEVVTGQLPEEVTDVSELPPTIKVILEDGTEAEVEVEWTEEADGTFVGKIVSAGYESAPALVISVKKAEVEESEYPIVITGVAKRPAGADGNIEFTIEFTLNADYAGDIVINDDDLLAVVYTVFELSEDGKKVPVSGGVDMATTVRASEITDPDKTVYKLVGELKGDVVSVNLINDFDWAKVVTGESLGSPVAARADLTIK